MVGLLRLARGCMALPLRSPKAMASTVRSSVSTKSRRERVAEPSSDRAMRLHFSPEQAAPPSSCFLRACSYFPPQGGLDRSHGARLNYIMAFQARLCCLLGRWADWSPSARVQRHKCSFQACSFLLNKLQAVQKGRPARPQARKNRRRTLWGTLRILANGERRVGKGASRRAGVGRVRRADFINSLLIGDHPWPLQPPHAILPERLRILVEDPG